MVPKLTTNGISLMVRAIGGEGITFTKVAIGNGDVPADYKELTTLQNGLVSMGIDEIITEDQYVIVKANMTNADFEAGFYWTELGVFAQDPDGGEDILYAYAHYIITGDEAATYIPASDSSLVEITHSVHVFVGELDNVTALLTKHSEFASAADLKDHVENEENPHKVTKEQVGLGLIINAKPEDQKPVFSNLVSAYSVNATTGKYTFSNIFSGERVGSILQKVRTLITLVINHFNATNPHKVTAAQAGAAAKSHQHTANDINKGTLGIPRGGTGGTTAAEARENFGIKAGQNQVEIVAGTPSLVEFAFATPYADSDYPYVVATQMLGVNKDLELGIRGCSPTGFEVFVYSPTYSGSVTFNWIACL